MQKGIIGKKLGMTQLFDENGKVVPVTVIEAGPCTVSFRRANRIISSQMYYKNALPVRRTGSSLLS